MQFFVESGSFLYLCVSGIFTISVKKSRNRERQLPPNNNVRFAAGCLPGRMQIPFCWRMSEAKPNSVGSDVESGRIDLLIEIELRQMDRPLS